MRLRTKTLLATAILIAAPMAANAESNTVTVGNATARLDFQVIIPRVLMLQVGAAGAGIDQINFDMTATPAIVGDASLVNGTGGNLTGGVVDAKVLGNNGTVTLVATATGPLKTTAGDTISYSEITTTATTGTVATPTILAAPVLTDAASAAVTLTPVAGVVKQNAKWTFKYKNTNVVPAGTYGGTVANNGRVTYTASMP